MVKYQRLRDLREDADLTQKQVADLISVSMNHYGKYERGGTDLPLEKAIILAKHYHVSLDYLAGHTNVKSTFAVLPKNPHTSLICFNTLQISTKNVLKNVC